MYQIKYNAGYEIQVMSARAVADGMYPARVENSQNQTQFRGSVEECEKWLMVIRIPMGTPAPSASGKTLLVASSRGNVKTSAMINGKPVTIGLNAYIPAN